jgi:hypothetical protein
MCGCQPAIRAALAAPLVLRPLRMRHHAQLAAQGRSETMHHAA